MARGAGQQLSTTNALGANAQNESNTLEQQLIPSYTNLMNTGYLNPEEEAAATTSEMGAATSPFQSAKFNATNEAAASRNPASLTSQEDQLALEEGQTAGAAAANLQAQKMQNQEQGMYGLNQLQAGNQQEAESMYGLGPATLQAKAAGGFNVGVGPFSVGVKGG